MNLPILPLDRSSSSDATLSDFYQHYRAAKCHYRSIREIERIFDRYVLPSIGHVEISAIDRTHITLLLDHVAMGGGKYRPVMARAVGAQLSAFFTWALARTLLLSDNPCRLAQRPPKPRSRSRVLNELELRRLWHVLDHEPLPWSAAIKLIALLGQRRNEVFDAEWSEFDLSARLWIIPGRRTKNGREHRVPLSDPAMSILADLPRTGAKLFPAKGNPRRSASGFSKAMRRINAKVFASERNPAPFALQDLRRTVATGLQRLGVKLEVTEAVLNHVTGSRDGVVGVYQRYQFEDEKRTALALWANDLARMTKTGETECRL